MRTVSEWVVGEMGIYQQLCKPACRNPITAHQDVIRFTDIA
jgi:hypothetical protein